MGRAEVLEARAAAKAALHYAKLQQAAIETQADCLSMIKRAEIRMAAISADGRRRGAVPAAKLSTMIICIGLDMIGQSSDLGVRLRASDRSAQQATATGWLC